MAEKILAVVAAKDRLIASQAMVMDLAKGVLGSKDVKGAVRTLVETAYKVVDADRIALYLVSKNRLICHVSPDPESIGKELPFGQGMVGHVARTGEVLNIEDAYSRPDLFDVSQDLLTGYTTRSVLTLPLRERDGRIIGVLQAINKSGSGGSGDEAVPFEPHDERNLDLLLALTSHQLHFSELTLQRQRATEWAESMLTLVEAISAERETGGAALALAHAAAGLLHCRRALVFLRDSSSNSLVCWAAVTSASSANGERGLRVEMTEAVLGEVATSGLPILLDRENHASELAALQQRLKPCFGAEVLPEACSALCAPLLDRHAGEAVGVLVAFDRLAALGDAEEPLLRRSPSPPSTPEAGDRSSGACLGHRRFSAARAMRSLLRDDSMDLSLPADEEAGPFHQSDLATVGVLSHSAANILRTAGLYERELQLNHRLGALMELITESRNLAEQKKTSELVAHVSGMGRKIFDCDRCTFFTVDHFNEQLVGFYVLDEEESSGERLKELRVPIKGIAGHVATTREPLNIKDAWNDERFNHEMDTATGYKTKTILCAPVMAANGRMVGILQCINKNGGRVFGSDDLEMLSMVTISLSDAIQAALLDNSYDSFIRLNGSISTEVKDMFRYFEKGAGPDEAPAAPAPKVAARRSRSKISTMAAMVLAQPKLKRMLTRSRTAQTFLDSMENWDHDLTPLETDNGLFQRSVRQTFERLSLSEPFSTVLEKVGPFLEALRGRYNTLSYHSWRHAMSTWHATFLLLGSPALFGLLPSEEALALLLAAFGHDVEHPGTSNNFQVHSMSSLALRYNDISVLENHHAALTSSLLEEEKVLADLELQPRQRIRQVIVSSILHTDMIKHKDNLAWLETCTADLPFHRESRQPLDPDTGLKLGSALLHCADLVHPTLPWKVHKQTSILIAEEFHAQYQEETRLGLPTLPFMGKDPKSLPELAPIQVGFLQFVAQPLWSALNFFVRENLLNEVVHNVAENKDRWKRLGEGEDIADDQPFSAPPQRPPPRKESKGASERSSPERSPPERVSSPTRVEFKEEPGQEAK